MKIIARVLLGLGAFLVVAAIVALTWAPGVVKKTPIDVDSTTVLSGEAARLDTDTGAFDTRPVYALSITQSDSEASSDDVAVFSNLACAVFDTGGEQVCLEPDDPNTISLAPDYFATDRTTAEAVESDALPAEAVPHEGLVNKWPFDAQQEDYPYWDGVTGSAVDAVYDRTEEIQGLETYVYQVSIDEAPITVVPALDLEGTYTDLKEIFVDPRTGAIIHQTDDQQRFLDDGTQVLDLQVAFTEEQQAANVADAEDNIATLDLITRTVPLVGFIGGALALAVGALLLVRARPRSERAPVAHRETETVGR